MRVLVVNAGSSSLKLALLGPGDDVVVATEVHRWDGRPPSGGLDELVPGLGPVDAVGHRVVHGGSRFTGAVVVDDGVIAAIESFTSLAPLHQPRAVAGLRAVGELLPAAPSVACFDTAFHATLPQAAATYALPGAWREQWGLRRFGFHGLSHAWAAGRAAELIGRVGDDGLRVVSCHLGAGSSLCAVVGGRSVDTTMGFTPLEGVVMATRSGSVDPGLLTWVMTEGGLDPVSVGHALEEESGLAGLSGGTGDMRDVAPAAQRGDPDARLALDVWLHRLCREVGAMAVSAGGLDVLVFTGGIGEHEVALRAAAAARLGFLGVAVDPAANVAAQGVDADVSVPGAPARTLVVTAREDIQIARETRRVLTSSGRP